MCLLLLRVSKSLSVRTLGDVKRGSICTPHDRSKRNLRDQILFCEHILRRSLLSTADSMCVSMLLGRCPLLSHQVRLLVKNGSIVLLRIIAHWHLLVFILAKDKVWHEGMCFMSYLFLSFLAGNHLIPCSFSFTLIVVTFEPALLLKLFNLGNVWPQIFLILLKLSGCLRFLFLIFHVYLRFPLLSILKFSVFLLLTDDILRNALHRGMDQLQAVVLNESIIYLLLVLECL